VRVFDDGGGFYPLWFELDPDYFWCGASEEDARETRERTPECNVTLGSLKECYPKGKMIE
jgi:hypothetical protein